ncbi:class I SAM-dependent methyltransferase [Haloimpatiens sp. FM7330]|uniref:class I SAM-dependent methyltransferase n=1 Tax=Haloimpatiens sp. FM7330 TaxID=3298610 RepID=UPI0036434F63
MESVKFLKQFICNPRKVGAVLPSSQKLANKMVENIEFEKAECIIEYGPGTGVFTEKLVERKKDDTILIVIEYNKKLCDIIRDKFKNKKNVYIVNDSAENAKEYLNDFGFNNADYIVSGLPFTSLPKDMSINILNITKEILSKEGNFITFQYSLVKKNFIEQFFTEIQCKRVIINIPPAYVLNCTNY